MPIELMPHQKKAVLEMKNGCILKGGVGSGKSITALAYYRDNEVVEERLIVITTAKKRDSGDWQAEARELALFPEVDSWNNLHQYEDVEGAFFIFDEQRVVGSGAWVSSFLRITKKNQWVLLSATPGDTWMDYVPVFIANGFYKNRTEFCRQHVVFSRFAKFPKVERFTGTQELARRLRSILVEMPFEKKTVRETVDVYVDYDRASFDMIWKRRWNTETQRPVRHVAELFALMRKVVYTHESRLRAIKDLLILHPRMIVFYNFDYELEILLQLEEGCHSKSGKISGSSTALAEERSCSFPPGFLDSFAVAQWNGHNHQPVPDTESWVYLVQYNAGSEGWNCITTDTTVFYSLPYSYRMFEQAKGRTDRLNTPYDVILYYILRSPSMIDMAVYKTLEAKKNFNETAAMKTWALKFSTSVILFGERVILL